MKKIKSMNKFVQGVKCGEVLLSLDLVPHGPVKPVPVQQQQQKSLLCVDLIKATKLIKSDLIGKSDPYAVLKFGQQIVKTQTINNSQVPVIF
jgi:Ca2+-dependent lipid-binding protein